MQPLLHLRLSAKGDELLQRSAIYSFAAWAADHTMAV
jgi:hypothetical protein